MYIYNSLDLEKATVYVDELEAITYNCSPFVVLNYDINEPLYPCMLTLASCVCTMNFIIIA